MFAENFLEGIRLQSNSYIGKYPITILDKSFLYKRNKIVIPSTTRTKAAVNAS